jgi:glycine cleavage system H protein
MSGHLVFMMGEFEALIPSDRQYAKNHMWAQRQDATDRAGSHGVYRFGFSAYAVRLLQDVYFLDWSVEAGTQLTDRQQIGFIESKKAESDLYAPLPGLLSRFNENLLSDPSTINVDKYGEGWLFEIQGSGQQLLSPEGYIEH